MKKVFGGVTALALLCVGAQAATVTTTITINGTGGTSGANVTAAGTVGFTGGLTASGTFSSTFSLSNPTVLQGTVPITLTVTSGGTTGTLTGTFSAAPSLLLQVIEGLPTASGPGTIAIASGTGGFSGTTGSFTVTASGTGVGTTGSGTGTFTLTGPGTLTISGGTTGPTPPAVTAVLNNYSYTPTGFPNSGLVPGSIVLIKGSNLADSTAQAVLQSSAGPNGIPTTLNGATVNATVGGTTVHLGLYYAIASQIAAVLPAGTPTGAGTLTVSYNGTPSATFNIQVVPSSFGLGTYNGGLAIATNATDYSLYGYTKSAKPGDVLVLWGSGLGGIPADSDTVYTSTPHAYAGTVQVYIGGIQANVTYAGNSGYPGLDQIDAVVPGGVLPGCDVSLAVVSGTGSNLVTSNITALAVDPSGGVCSDTAFGTNGNSINTLAGQSTIRSGSVLLAHTVSPGNTAGTTQTNDLGEAAFQKLTGGSYSSISGRASIGSCTVTQTVTGTAAVGTTTGLDAGSVTVTGPSGSAPLSAIPGGVAPGIFVSILPTGFIPTSGGVFTFSATGGADVGKFSATVTFPNPLLTWTNQAAAATITRSSGVDVNWTGGTSGTYVEITGSSANTTTGVSGSYFCFAPVSAGTFHVPGYIASTLPSGTGTTSVTNETNFASFTATGLDYGFSFGFSQTSVNSVYQ